MAGFDNGAKWFGGLHTRLGGRCSFCLLLFTTCAECNEALHGVAMPSFMINSIFLSSYSVSESDLLATESPGLGAGELKGEHSDEERLSEDSDELEIDFVCLYVREE
jgi:hypothetical protein